MLSAIFAAAPDDADHLKNLVDSVLTHNQQIRVNEMKNKDYPIKLLRDLSDYTSGAWHDVLKGVGLLDERVGIQNRINGYCINVVQL